MRKIIVILMIILFFSGCGYKLGSMTVGGIQTISLMPVINKTDKTYIDESFITNSLIQQFNRDGTIKVVKPEIADAYLYVHIADYFQTTQIYTSNNIGSNFRMNLKGLIKVIKKDTENLLLHDKKIGYAVYENGIDQYEMETIYLREAIKDLSIKIVRAIVEGGDW